MATPSISPNIPPPQSGDDADKVVAATLAHPDYVNASPEKQQLVRDILREKYITNRTPGGTTFKNVPASLNPQTPIKVSNDRNNAIDSFKPISEVDVINTIGGGNLNEKELATQPFKLGHLLPALGAMLSTAAAGPESGFLRALAAAMLGGTAGEAVNQSGQAAAGTPESPKSAGDAVGTSLGSGMTQMGIEALGRILGYPIQKVLGGIKGNAPATAAEIADRKFNLGLTPGQQTRAVVPRSIERMAEHNVVGYSTAEPYREAIEGRANQATKDVVSGAFGSSPNDMAGARVQSTIEDIGSPAFKEQIKKLSSLVSAGMFGKTVDWTGVKQEAARELSELTTQTTRPINPILRALYPSMQLATAQPSTGRKAILTDIMHMKDNPTFEDVRNLRSKWMAIGPQSTELMSNDAKGAAKHYIQSATEVLDNAVANDPINKARWNAFRNFTRRGAETMDSSNITSLLNGDPEKVASSIGNNDITKVRDIKRAVLGYASRYGSPEDGVKANLAWDKFRGSYIRQNLLNGDLGTLSKRITDADPVIKTLFSDVKGKQNIANLKLIGDAMAKIDTVSERGVGTRWQVLKGIPAAWVVNMAYNPSATRFFVRGLNGLAQDSRYSAIQAAGKASAKATPYLGNALADVMRALQMSQTAQESASPSSSTQ